MASGEDHRYRLGGWLFIAISRARNIRQTPAVGYGATPSGTSPNTPTHSRLVTPYETRAPPPSGALPHALGSTSHPPTSPYPSSLPHRLGFNPPHIPSSALHFSLANHPHLPLRITQLTSKSTTKDPFSQHCFRIVPRRVAVQTYLLTTRLRYLSSPSSHLQLALPTRPGHPRSCSAWAGSTSRLVSSATRGNSSWTDGRTHRTRARNSSGAAGGKREIEGKRKGRPFSWRTEIEREKKKNDTVCNRTVHPV